MIQIKQIGEGYYGIYKDTLPLIPKKFDTKKDAERFMNKYRNIGTTTPSKRFLINEILDKKGRWVFFNDRTKAKVEAVKRGKRKIYSLPDWVWQCGEKGIISGVSCYTVRR